ncbi:ATP-binding protein [Streptomyces sp. VNUA116]|uniref:ATP-binding protein n=1 Tax=Streptomyces sp. VNUA116 TaxID=3062449 RepID=UPI0026769514|nr:ATP-binding protein [Streptomyces sp. VNUA116]WKU45957.1 ATP-binding protein [Streptomyces sp. VNUA116]
MVTLALKRYEPTWRPPVGPPPQLILESSREAPAAARDFARQYVEYALDDPDPDHLYDVALVVSELVTNSVRYGTEHPGSMLVVLDADDARTRIEVHDTVRRRPQIKPEDTGSRRGRGLHIVDALATWGTGTRPGGQGKFVWAEVPGR